MADTLRGGRMGATIRSFPWRRRPRLPAGERIYAVGDIHGRYDLLADLFLKISGEQGGVKPMSTQIILLGDLIDRGPQSAHVVELARKANAMLERVRSGSRHKVRVLVLKGNHEEVLVEAWRGDRDALAGWLAFGGIETLVSYGVYRDAIDPDDLGGALALVRQAIPSDVIDWLDALPLFSQSGDYVFAHAGIRPGIPLDRQEAPDLLWIRDEFLDFEGSHGKVIVHGHTISPEVEYRSNRIGIDTGAYATGKLSALCLCGTEQRVIDVERDTAQLEDVAS